MILLRTAGRIIYTEYQKRIFLTQLYWFSSFRICCFDVIVPWKFDNNWISYYYFYFLKHFYNIFNLNSRVCCFFVMVSWKFDGTLYNWISWNSVSIEYTRICLVCVTVWFWKQKVYLYICDVKATSFQNTIGFVSFQRRKRLNFNCNIFQLKGKMHTATNNIIFYYVFKKKILS